MYIKDKVAKLKLKAKSIKNDKLHDDIEDVYQKYYRTCSKLNKEHKVLLDRIFLMFVLRLDWSSFWFLTDVEWSIRRLNMILNSEDINTTLQDDFNVFDN